MTDAALGGELAQLTSEYEILGELGRGGSAVVYRARDRGLGRDVAIKVVHPRPSSADDDAVARLAREARTVAQLQHPNIVTVFAVRSLAGGGLALVMQLVPGRTLKAVVHQDGPFAPERCERVLRDVASALAYAHARGVVHRDVKPENIFIDEESGRALLSDFGIARSDDFESLTLTGTAIGTPFYMSPEQIDGAAVDGRSDLYSLGLVAWEMLTGRRPWDGESLYNVIYKQKHEDLPPIEALRSGVPTRLQYIVERMLQKNRAARWAGAEGLLVQLSHTVLPGDYGRWQTSLRKRVDRHRAVEKERERAAAEAPAAPTGGGLLASTIRFVRGAGAPTSGGRGSSGVRLELGRKGAAHAPKPTSALADTMVVRRGTDGETELPPANAVAGLPVPSPHGRATAPDTGPSAPSANQVAEPAIDPTWALPATESTGRRWLLFASAGVAVGAMALVTLDVRGALDWVLPEGGAPPAAAAPVSTPLPATSASELPTVRDAATASSVTALAAVRATAPAILALGARHSCAVTSGGTVQCWGANERGQLGDGTAQRQTAPVRVAVEISLAGVAAGAAQSCAVTRTGDVYCWGNDTNGQLGDATTVRRNAPVRVAGPGVYRAVVGGDSHTCAITVGGAVHCWGSNARGQLGADVPRLRTIPTAVAPPPDGAVRFVQVVAGAAHSCALTDEGVAYCWGANERGQLGVGAGADRRTPTKVDATTRFALLAAGSQHTCGMTELGVVSCWGANGRGQIGTGARTASESAMAVRLPLPAISIAAGAQHSCALVSTGEAYCWGANGTGQIGSGSVADAPSPARVSLPEPVATIAAGSAHTCTATATGALFCWGSNAEGQLGDGTRINRLTPARVLFDDGAPPRAANSGR